MPIEGHAAVPQGDVRVVPDDQVVEDVDVEKPARSEGLRGEVEVREEELQRYFCPTSVIDSITTGFTGTFWCMPRLPVGTATILFTTSMPLTTLPNTV